MVKLISYLFLVLVVFSCKKQNLHKLKFKFEVIEDCQSCYSDYFSVSCKPRYSDQQPKIHAGQLETGSVWEYEYWELKDGDEVIFNVSPTGMSYTYRISVYVDDKIVSYRECYGPYGKTILTDWGLNNAKQDESLIKFYYYE